MLFDTLLSIDTERRDRLGTPGAASSFMRLEDGEAWGLDRLLAQAERVAAGLAAAGVEAGDRVALHLGNGPEIAIAYLACFCMGAIAAPLNLRFKQLELEDVVSRLQPKAYIGDLHRIELLAPYLERNVAVTRRFVVGETTLIPTASWASLVEHEPLTVRTVVDAHAPAVFLTTSGTTGKPKFVAHSQSTLLEMALRFDTLNEGDRLAFILPMVHGSGLLFSLAAFLSGSSLIMMDGTDVNGILDGIEKHRCTTLIMVPVIAAQLVASQRAKARDLSSMRRFATGGDTCHLHIRETFEATVGIPLRSFWASTEGAGSLGCSSGSHPAFGPMPGVELQLVDPDRKPVILGEMGQLLIRGPHVALGYWEASHITAFPDGWYPTGDVMRQNEQGDFEFVARLKDLIVRAGSNISPVEVEQVILSHAGVVDATVVGAPDVELGQRVIGFVQLSAGISASLLDEVMRFMRGRLADYKVPERLIHLQQIPRNALGKVDRSALLAML